MKVDIFKARDMNSLRAKIQKLIDDGAYIERIKFESFVDAERQLLVYFRENSNQIKQEVVTNKGTIKGTVSFLNHELLNSTKYSSDTVSFDRNGLLAIVVKDILQQES